MVAANTTIRSVGKAPEAPKVPEGWTALWDAEEQGWYYYNPRTKSAQWESPTPAGTSSRRCGMRRILPACFFPKIEPAGRAGKAPALPSEATLQAIERVDRDFNDVEIAMVLQHEEFSQDLSGRRHSFDQDWVDTENYNEAGPSSAAPPLSQLAGHDLSLGHPGLVPLAKVATGTARHQQRECGICMDDGGEDAQWSWLPCTHQFHTACVEGWLKTANRCPVCRTEPA